MNGRKILIFINSSWNFINFRQRLIKDLSDAGYTIIALAPEDSWSGKLIDLNVTYIPIKMNAKSVNPIHELTVFFEVFNVLRETRPDFFLGFTIKPNVYGGLACRLLGIERIHNIAGLGATFSSTKLRRWFSLMLYKLSLRGSTFVFFQNSSDRQRFLAEGVVNEERSSVVPGSGVDLKKFSQTAFPDSGKKRFLFAARLLWDKGVREFYSVAVMIRNQRKDVEFVIAGFLQEHAAKGVTRDIVTSWVNEGAVSYCGAVDDMEAVISQAHCVVLPSYYPEGTPRFLLEGLASGRVIITSDMPGCRDVVDHGSNGFLVEPRSEDALRDAILDVLSLSDAELRSFGGLSRHKAESCYDDALISAEYLTRLRAGPDY